jgi:predicted amidohydrolase YtcJ
MADLPIRAGAIYTMNADPASYRAIATRGDSIVALSSESHGLDELISSKTRVIDDPQLARR